MAFVPLDDSVDRPGLKLSRRQVVLLRIADAVALAGSAGLAALVLEMLSPVRAGGITVIDILICAVGMSLSLELHRLYRRPNATLRPSGWWRASIVARCIPTASLLTLGIGALLAPGNRMTLTAAVAMTLPAVVLVPFTRRLVVAALGGSTVTQILVVGTGEVADRLRARLSRCADTHVVGHVDDDPAPGYAVLGSLTDLPRLCRSHGVDSVIVAFSDVTDRAILASLRKIDRAIPIAVIPRMFELCSWRSGIEELYGLPLVHVPSGILDMRSRFEKRAMDLLTSVSLILVTAPLWLVAAVAIKLDSRGPVFFRQDRAGLGGRPFRIFKFRTMTAEAWENRAGLAADNEVDGPLFKMANDPRVTRVGAVLRKTSIDELPQLLNVLRGEMSMVGPRPLPVEESCRLDGPALDRMHVVPGLTGLWQVSGRSDLTYADLQHLDSVYARSRSLMWDIRIMRATPASVFGKRGAY